MPRLLIYPDHERMKYLNLKLPKIGFKIGSYENVSFADEKN